MDTYPVDLNIKLATIYYNAGKLNLFRVCVDVMLLDLKDQLYEINHQTTKETQGWWKMLSIVVH
jgi:hypothetical protein